MKFKAHDKPINEYTEIDKFLLIPKKLWEDFGVGDTSLKLDGKSKKLRIYEIPCECVTPRHQHRIIDLRDVWNELNLSANQEIEISR